MFSPSSIRSKLCNRWTPILVVSLLVLAFVVRIITALSMNVVYDEIPYVYWIGSWFSKHFLEYFFQLQHHIYPPRSPLFANPPFGIWLLTIGVYLSQSLDYNILLGARIINVLTGVILCFVIYKVGKTIFDGRIGLLAAGFYALSPQAIAADARAYLDTTLSLLTFVSFYFFYLYISRKREKYFILSSIAFGLALLTKSLALSLWISILLIFLCTRDRQRNVLSIRKVFVHGIIALVLATALWAGLRDIAHVKEVIAYRISPPKPLAFSFDLFCPVKLAFFQTSTVTSALLVVSLFFFARCVVRKRMNSSRIFLLIPFLTTLAFNGLFASTFHVLVPVLPYAFLLASYTVFYLIPKIHPIPILRRIPGNKVVPFLLILLQSVAFFSMRIGYAGMYTNILYRLAEGQIRAGDGEGMKEVADWVKVNLPIDSKIYVLGSEWLLHFYLTDGDTSWKNYPYSAGRITTEEPGRSLNITRVTQTYDCVILHTSYLQQGSPYYELFAELQKMHGEPDFVVYSNWGCQIAVRGYLTRVVY